MGRINMDRFKAASEKIKQSSKKSVEDVKEIIERDFAKAGGNGYVVVPAQVLHAADYGVPQSRERVIFFGFKKSGK